MQQRQQRCEDQGVVWSASYSCDMRCNLLYVCILCVSYDERDYYAEIEQKLGLLIISIRTDMDVCCTVLNTSLVWIRK